jgi:soluble lytic murein transglycosylase-like protein
MLRRLRLRRSVWAAIAVGVLAAPLLMGGSAANSMADAGLQLPPPEPDRPRETLPPDPSRGETRLVLAQTGAIADLAPEEYRNLVIAVAGRFKIDPRLIAAIVTVETEWDPHVVGRFGERGLMQILPETGRYLAAQAGLAEYDLADPATSLMLGAQYLAELLQEYGSPERALAAYNGGPDAVAEAAVNLYARRVLQRYLTRPQRPVSLHKVAA